MEIDLTKEDMDELAEKVNDYKRFLESDDFSAQGRKYLMEELSSVVLLLIDEVQKLQREIRQHKKPGKSVSHLVSARGKCKITKR